MPFFNKAAAPSDTENSRISPERSKTLDVIIALIPAAFAGISVFGIRAAAVIAVTVISSVLFEHLYCVIRKSPTTVGDLTAVITGLILAFSLPVKVPLYVPVFGSAVAIIIVKLLSGGKGKNFLNPAITARAALYIAFIPSLTKFTVPSRNPVDAVSCATPLRVLSQLDMSGDIAEQIGSLTDKGELPGLINMLFGVKAGCIGEVCTVALILGGIYLILRGVISFVFPVTFMGSFALATFIFSGFSPLFTLYYLLSGGVILGAFFIATDPVTSPDTLNKRLLSGVLAGILTAVIRFFTPLPEGVTVVILLMNLTLFTIKIIPVLKARITERKNKENSEEISELPDEENSETENKPSPVGEGSPLPPEESSPSAEIPSEAENEPSLVGDGVPDIPPDSTPSAEETPFEAENDDSPVGEGSPLPPEDNPQLPDEEKSEAENEPSPVGDGVPDIPSDSTPSAEESPSEVENEDSPVGEGSPLPPEESSPSAEIPSEAENEDSPVGEGSPLPSREPDSSSEKISKPVFINELTPDTDSSPEVYTEKKKKKGRKAKKKQKQMPDFSEPLPEVIPEFLKKEIEKQKTDKGE
ncbi:MAG: RnfABCDGE type electron transport complex subunit D [Clostridia bacterium]|nr:RnfABCDGE type electron transport complex subunit D [Clostridia bacterium]